MKTSSGDVQGRLSGLLQRPKPLHLVLIIVLVSCAAYYNILSNDFVLDDRVGILHNRFNLDIRAIPEIFSTHVWGFQGKSVPLNYYRPLGQVFGMVIFGISGTVPKGWHMASLLWHTAVSVLVFMVAERLLRDRHAEGRDLYPPFFAALLFALHPVHTEAVAWAASMGDLFVAFFFLLSLYFHLRFREGLKSGHAAAVFFFLAACFCKEPALMLLPAIILYDYLFMPPVQGHLMGHVKRWTAYIPYALAAGLYLTARYYALGGLAPQEPSIRLDAWQYTINVFPLFALYLWKLIFPVYLNFFYVFHPLTSLAGMVGVGSLLATLGFILILLLCFRKSRLTAFALLLIALPLLPALYIPGLSRYPFAERYLYLSSFGFVLLPALALRAVRRTVPQTALVLTVVLVLTAAGYSFLTVKRNTVWKDEYTFYMDSPHSAESQYNFGCYLMRVGQPDAAITAFQRALSLDPDVPNAHYNMGMAFFFKGQMEPAIEQFRWAIMQNPGDRAAHYHLRLASSAASKRP